MKSSIGSPCGRERINGKWTVNEGQTEEDITKERKTKDTAYFKT